MQQQSAASAEAAPDGAGEPPTPNSAPNGMSPTTAPPTPAADAPARPPVGWSPGPLPLGTLAADGLPHAAAMPPSAGLIPAPAADTLSLEVAALPALEQVPAEWPHAGLHPAAAADGNGSGAVLPPPAAAAPEALQGAPQATQEVAPAEQQARDAECAGAADGARGRLPKLSVFKGMGKAAAAAAAKLTDGERGGKARAASAGKGPGPDPKGAKPDQAPGGLDGPDSATAGDLGANPAGPPNPMEGPGEAGEGKADAEESDAVKAERSWAAAMGAGSLIHDLFRGQLQSSIECQTCKRRSTMCALYPIRCRSIFTKVCRWVGGVPITPCATKAVRQIYDCQENNFLHSAPQTEELNVFAIHSWGYVMQVRRVLGAEPATGARGALLPAVRAQQRRAQEREALPGGLLRGREAGGVVLAPYSFSLEVQRMTCTLQFWCLSNSALLGSQMWCYMQRALAESMTMVVMCATRAADALCERAITHVSPGCCAWLLCQCRFVAEAVCVQ